MCPLREFWREKLATGWDSTGTGVGRTGGPRSATGGTLGWLLTGFLGVGCALTIFGEGGWFISIGGGTAVRGDLGGSC